MGTRKLKNYRVMLKTNAWTDIEIEARSPAEAEAKAIEWAAKGEFNHIDYDRWWTDDETVVVDPLTGAEV